MSDLERAAVQVSIGAAILDVGAMRDKLEASRITHADFSDARLSAIWALVESSIRDGREPTLEVASELLGSRVSLDFLRGLFMSGRAGDPTELLCRVREAGRRRRISTALVACEKSLKSPEASRPELVAELSRVLELECSDEASAKPAGADLLSLVDHLEQVAKHGKSPVLPTGIPGLDAIIGGLQPTLTVLGALPGVGKSALVASILRNIAMRGEKVGFFSLEDDRRWLTDRLMSERARVPLFVLLNRPLTQEQRMRVDAAATALFEIQERIIIDDRQGLTASELSASASVMISVHGVRAIIVDHLGELSLSRQERSDIELTDALRELRAIAKRHRIPVMVAMHVKRSSGGKDLTDTDAPKLSDFAGTSGAERTARVALVMTRLDDEDRPDGVRVWVVKQTNGKAGTSVDLRLNVAAGTILNASASTEEVNSRRLYEQAEKEMPHAY